MILYTAKHKIPFQIDEDDEELVSRFSWHIPISNGKLMYPTTSTSKFMPGGQRALFLHILLLGKASSGFEWDHRNQDKLDNRRNNLRLVPLSVNRRNRGLQINNTTGVRGVRKAKYGWIVHLGNDYLGHFKDIEEAIQVRMNAEKELWGDQQ